tara:strand:+ start:8821 stop:9261 length:441 start_codon:yes stop_codon:yes gene_type:complete
MTTTVKMINENNNEATYFIDGLVNGKCFVAGLSYTAKIEREGTFIIKFDSTIHHLYTHISKNDDYIIQSKDSTINMKEKYNDYVTFTGCPPDCEKLINSICPKANYPSTQKCMQCTANPDYRSKITSTCGSGLHNCILSICNKYSP